MHVAFFKVPQDHDNYFFFKSIFVNLQNPNPLVSLGKGVESKNKKNGFIFVACFPYNFNGIKKVKEGGSRS